MPTNFPNKIFLIPVVAVASLIIGLFLFARFGPAIPFSTVTTTKTDLFTVAGEGKATAVPDIAQVSLGITVKGSSVAQVQSQANTTINSVTAAIKNLGIDSRDIQTTNYNLRPDLAPQAEPRSAGSAYDFGSGRQTINGYVAYINLSVKVRNFDKINQVIDTATANGANQVGGLNFILDDSTREKAEGEARKMAIDAAKKKAAQIAAESGLTLGRIINVSEGFSPRVLPMPLSGGSLAKAEDNTQTQIQPGSSEISVTIAISYETR